jgi:hypothetical protein
MSRLPIAQIVCWKCKRGDITLYRLRDTFGFKTPDYACALDRVHGLPDPLNQSFILYPTRAELEEMKKVLAGTTTDEQQPAQI